jgi:hypothetical protein
MPATSKHWPPAAPDDAEHHPDRHREDTQDYRAARAARRRITVVSAPVRCAATKLATGWSSAATP